MKIAVAMSGGVDSSVAAALMVQKYGVENVFGVTMKLFCYGDEESSDKSCCSLDAITDAAAVCKQLGIPHYVVNLEKEFQKDVIDDFISQYAVGITPNPCVRCNQFVKYEHLLKKAIELGADKLVTGHYARVSSFPRHPEELGKLSQRREDLEDCRVVSPRNDEVIYHLLKGLDNKKDQSYFLYNLNQEQLDRVEFPIGELEKTETRKLAKEFGLKTAEKTESQDICFVATTTQDFLSSRIKQKPGDIVTFSSRHSREGGNPDSSEKKIVGRHNGLAQYTIGQRKGLGGGFTKPTYVIGLNIENNEVVVGGKEQLYSKELVVDKIHWISDFEPKLPLKCRAKIRYNSPEAECEIIYSSSGVEKSENNSSRLHSNDNMRVIFETPQLAITPGQSIVFYKGEEVLGGGIILSAVNS